MNEAQAIARLRKFATDPAARGLADDVALFDGLVLTHDSIAEGVHFLPDDPAASVGWKLVTVNLSDLAAKGAEPAAALLSLAINQDGDWVDAFIGGVEAACTSYGLPLIGGDTIALPATAPRVFGLTAIAAPARARLRAAAGKAATSCGSSAPSATPPPASPCSRTIPRPRACSSKAIAARCRSLPPAARWHRWPAP